MPDETVWAILHNPTTNGTHQVPNNPDVIADFQARGWETPDDATVRVAAEASDLHGKALDGALDSAGLSKSGTVAEKQARLAGYEEAELAATTTEEEGLNNG